MREFEKQLNDEQCKEYFKILFGGIWEEEKLLEIIFSEEAEKEKYDNDLVKWNAENENRQRSKLESLAGFFGDSIWEVFSNNHSVYKIEGQIEFDTGSWRGTGSFISDFIESENSSLSFCYMDFYMGHYKDEKPAEKSYAFIFRQLKENGFDWHYAYPALGLMNFSPAGEKKPELYDPNEMLEKEIEKQKMYNLIDDMNMETFEKIQTSPLPPIIKTYIKVYNKYPDGWIEN